MVLTQIGTDDFGQPFYVNLERYKMDGDYFKDNVCVHGTEIGEPCSGLCEHGALCGAECEPCDKEFWKSVGDLTKLVGYGDAKKGAERIVKMC